jgi:hypothetical protein
MPVKIWDRTDDRLTSRVVTEWERTWTAEEYRNDADELDALLDKVLDASILRVELGSDSGLPAEFVRAWAIGRELNDSAVFDAPAMQREPIVLLWRALAKKCRTGARADGSMNARWGELRPPSSGEPRREGGRLDYFQMCRWLAEQEVRDAGETFGGSIRNVWQMLERPTLRPLVVRSAFLAWLRTLRDEARKHLHDREVFAEMMKTLRRRWPDRGPGSAKRPIHYTEEELATEIKRLLSRFVTRQNAA